MSIEQVSVFLENQPGRMTEILRCLGAQGIDLRAYSFAETSDFGIMRMLVRHADSAVAALRQGGFTAKKNEVLGLIVPDETGSTVAAFELLGQAGINVEYTYAFAIAAAGQAFVLLRVDDHSRAEALLAAAGVQLAAPEDLF